MPFQQFAATLGAVITGNLLVAAFIWALVQMSRAEKLGKPETDLSWLVIFWAVAGPLVGAGAIYFSVSL